MLEKLVHVSHLPAGKCDRTALAVIRQPYSSPSLVRIDRATDKSLLVVAEYLADFGGFLELVTPFWINRSEVVGLDATIDHLAEYTRICAVFYKDRRELESEYHRERNKLQERLSLRIGVLVGEEAQE